MSWYECMTKFNIPTLAVIDSSYNKIAITASSSDTFKTCIKVSPQFYHDRSYVRYMPGLTTITH